MYVKQRSFRNNSVAFLPETFRFHNEDRDLIFYSVMGYWHEISHSSGRHVAGTGIYLLGLSRPELPKNFEQVTYEHLLKIIQPERYGTWIARYAEHKLGDKRPYRWDAIARYGRNPNEVDAAELPRMLKDDSYMPAGADGWYDLKRGIAD